MTGLTQEQADILYAAIAHLHDERYSQLGHDHNDLYSLLTHNHDERYSQLGHTHSEFSNIKHPALQMLGSPASFESDFRALNNALPAGWAWAGSPFVTPNTISYTATHLLFRHTGGSSRVFLYKTAPSIPGGFTTYDYYALLSGFYNSNGFFHGLRLDDGTDNNYFEFGSQKATTGSPIRWYYYERNGGGSVVSGEFSSFAMAQIPPYLWITLSPRGTIWSSWSGRGQLVTDMFSQLTGGTGKTWTPSRIGITQRRTSDQWDMSYLVGTGIVGV